MKSCQGCPPPTPTLPHQGGGRTVLPPPWWGRVGVGGELVSAGDHLQRRLEGVRRQIAIGISTANKRVKFRYAPIVHRGASDELLSQHVETVDRDADLFNAPGGHLARQHSLFKQIA